MPWFLPVILFNTFLAEQEIYFEEKLSRYTFMCELSWNKSIREK